jgi:hypothetical protein
MEPGGSTIDETPQALLLPARRNRWIVRSDAGMPVALSSAAFAAIRSLRVRQRGSYSGRGRASSTLSGGRPVSTSIRCRSHNCARARAGPGTVSSIPNGGSGTDAGCAPSTSKSAAATRCENSTSAVAPVVVLQPHRGSSQTRHQLLAAVEPHPIPDPHHAARPVAAHRIASARLISVRSFNGRDRSATSSPCHNRWKTTGRTVIGAPTVAACATSGAGLQTPSTPPPTHPAHRCTGGAVAGQPAQVRHPNWIDLTDQPVLPINFRTCLPHHGERDGRPRVDPLSRPAVDHQPDPVGQPGEEVRRVPARLARRSISPMQPERLRRERRHLRIEVQQDRVIAFQPRFEPDMAVHRRSPVQARKMPLPAVRRELPNRRHTLKRRVGYHRQRLPDLALIPEPGNIERVHHAHIGKPGRP